MKRVTLLEMSDVPTNDEITVDDMSFTSRFWVLDQSGSASILCNLKFLKLIPNACFPFRSDLLQPLRLQIIPGLFRFSRCIRRLFIENNQPFSMANRCDCQ